MNETTKILKRELEGINYQILDIVESKTSTYWYIWNSEFGEIPFETNENDYRVKKLRFSNHDAICERSYADFEVVAEFGCSSWGTILVDGNEWLEDYSKEDILAILKELYDFNFNMEMIEDDGPYGTKIKVCTNKYQELTAKLFLQYLLNN